MGDYGEGHVCLGGALARPCTISVVSYIFEIIDDLMIEPSHNVSQSGCMEAFMMGRARHAPSIEFSI